MNKKGQFVAILSFFVVLGLIAVFFILEDSTGEVVRMYYTPSYVLNQNFEIREYLFNLNQEIKYDSFKSFEYFCENGGMKAGCKAWYENCELDLVENFKSYFTKPNYNVGIKVENKKFAVDYVYNGVKTFEEKNVKIELKPETNYVLNYEVYVIEELYEKCRDVISCDALDDCKVSRCDDSSDINYIKIELDFKDNDFIEPKLRFKIKIQRL